TCRPAVWRAQCLCPGRFRELLVHCYAAWVFRRSTHRNGAPVSASAGRSKADRFSAARIWSGGDDGCRSRRPHHACRSADRRRRGGIGRAGGPRRHSNQRHVPVRGGCRRRLRAGARGGGDVVWPSGGPPVWDEVCHRKGPGWISVVAGTVDSVSDRDLRNITGNGATHSTTHGPKPARKFGPHYM